ncbi:MAG: hypothetical protein U0797_17115 [Gemmataceae bacterium]
MRPRTFLALALLAGPTGAALAHIGGGFRGGGFHYGGGGIHYGGFSGGGFHYGGYAARNYSLPHYSMPNYTTSFRPSYAPRYSYSGWSHPGYLPNRSFNNTYNRFNTWNVGNRNVNSFRLGESRGTTINATRIGGWSPTVVNRGWARPSIGIAGNRITNVNVIARPVIRPPVVGPGPVRIGGGNVINNRFTNINAYSARNLVNTARFYNRPWGRYYPWYHGGWHGWRYWPSFWGGWAWGWGLGFALGSAADVAYAGPTIVYDNPYYVPVPVPAATASPPVVIQESNTYVVPQPLDYSRPIQVPTEQQASQADDELAKESRRKMDQAVAAFKAGDYPQAMRECDEAVKLLPGDTNLHEFRALVQFAQKKYKDAAGTLYAVLAAGPGWDWNTLSSFYHSEDAYTRQLRALEGFARDHPADAAGHFVLAYHYLVLDQRAAARDQLAEVVKLQPKDKVSAGLLDALDKGLAGDKDTSE